MQYRKTRRKLPLPTLECSRCHCDCDAHELICEDCSDEFCREAADDARAERWEGMELDAQREFARVYLDLRYVRQGDAMRRLERVLDDAAPDWRELT